jgi:hypothetical protein
MERKGPDTAFFLCDYTDSLEGPRETPSEPGEEFMPDKRSSDPSNTHGVDPAPVPIESIHVGCSGLPGLSEDRYNLSEH